MHVFSSSLLTFISLIWTCEDLCLIRPIATQYFVAVANDVYLPRLEDCSLSGFILRNQESISKLFNRHSRTLERVSLAEMDIGSGTWELVLRGFGSRTAFPAFRYVRLRMLKVGVIGTYSPLTVRTRSESGEMEEKTGWWRASLNHLMKPEIWHDRCYCCTSTTQAIDNSACNEFLRPP